MGIVVMTIVVGALTSQGSSAKPGDCLEVEGKGGKIGSTSQSRVVPCTASNATYKVAKLGDRLGCDDNNYGYIFSSRNSRAQCLILNAKVGDCFHQEIWFPTGKAAKVPCGPSATYRIAAVIPGGTDPAACGEDINPLGPPNNDLSRPLAIVYPQPPLTICTVGA